MSYLLDISGSGLIKNNAYINKNISNNFIVAKTTDSSLSTQVDGNVYLNNLYVSRNLNIIPAGLIMASILLNAPVGWLLCNGQSVSRNTYANLYTAIYNTFGSGDGTTTFNVPNYQAAFLRGAGTYDTSHNATLNTSQMDTIKSHTHGVNDPGHVHDTYAGGESARKNDDNFYRINGLYNGFNTQATTTINAANITINNTGDIETRPYSWVVNYFIKY